MRNGSDRVCALIAGAAASELMKHIIAKSLKRIDEKLENELFYDPGAALGSFSSRIKLAYAMGLIDQERMESAQIIKKIRNVFAHTSNNLAFDTPEIADQCGKLNAAAEFPTYLPRDWFQLSSLQLFHNLIGKKLEFDKREALIQALHDYKPASST
jgi:DNA-binding MltR family transcriptional regulator